jgi:hypothetical protein
MPVKKVGHSLIFVKDVHNKNNDEIYCIGGITDKNIRTRLCEKYNVKKKKWTSIGVLNKGRSRPAIA